MKVLRAIVTSESPELTEQHFELFKGHIWPFMLENEWEYVDSLEHADVVCFTGVFGHDKFLSKLKNKQIALMLEIFHIDDMFDQTHFDNILKTYNHNNNKIIIVHKNKCIPDSKHFIYYDCMFNRQKLYFTEHYKIANIPDLVWTMGTNQETYTFPKNKAAPGNCRYMLSPNLVYHGLFVPRMRYRQALQDWLSLRYKDKCFINSKENNFLSNNPTSFVKNKIKEGTGGFWFPVGDDYYRQSFISVYIETITSSYHKTRCITEKTFDPLIKGNFIIPFAYPGILKDLIEYGFRIPTINGFIDYSYDEITDNDVRFSKFLLAIDKIFINHTIESLYEIYHQNLEIIEHNRNLFFTKPYYKLHAKIVNNILGK